MKRIGNISNYYGGLFIREEDGKYFWTIENFVGYYEQEIPKSLYDELNKFEDDQLTQNNKLNT